ncbi:MAG: ABC-2 transporter permease [Bacillota bacterium]|nr:ABC-2 transporter permease [Bacillota bacterium]
MKALLLRDLRIHMLFFLSMILLSFLYSMLIFTTGSVDGLVGFLVVFIPSLTGVVLFLKDKEFIQHTAAMPVTRCQLVVAKYLSTCIYGGFIVLITILITGYLGRFFPNSKIDFFQLISLRGFIFAILPITLIVSLSYPLLFKYGLGLGVKILLGGFTLLYAIGMLIGERFVKNWLELPRRGIFAAAMALFIKGEERFGLTAFYTAFILILCVLFFGSVILSLFWMNRKDIL